MRPLSTIAGLRSLAEDLGFHVWNVGQYPDARVCLVLSPHPAGELRESEALEIMADEIDLVNCGIGRLEYSSIWVGT